MDVFSVINAIFPDLCLNCAANKPVTLFLCTPCLHMLDQCRIPACELPGTTPAGRNALGRFYYRSGSPIRALHRALKYEGRVEIGEWFGQQMSELSPGAVDACLPLPSHRSRVLERGFLHTLPIASSLAVALDIPLLRSALVRDRLARPQSDMQGEDRRSNVKGVFSVVEKVSGLRLLLVDDIMTTGSTLDAAALVLERAGAAVTLITAAFRREAFRVSDNPLR